MTGRKSRVATMALAVTLTLALGGVSNLHAQPAPSFTHTLSSGLFSLPANGVSVDWAVSNSSAVNRTVRVTVYRHGTGVPRAVVAPGALTITLAPTETTHNANGVGTVFQRGFYYEVVVETNSLRVLPIVHVWEDTGNTVIPGTLIPSGSWVRLR